MVAMNKGEQVPDGWIVDQHGKPTTDPKDFYDGGALLTIGEHKGSGLSILTDLLAGAITTGRSSDPADTVLRNNMLSIFIAPAVYDGDGARAGGGAPARRLGQGVAAARARAAGAGAGRRRAAHARSAARERRTAGRQDAGRSFRRRAIGGHRSRARTAR